MTTLNTTTTYNYKPTIPAKPYQVSTGGELDINIIVIINTITI